MTKTTILALALCLTFAARVPMAFADDKPAAEKADKADKPGKATDNEDTKKEEKAEKADAAAAGSITCKSGKDTRTLVKKDMEAGGCEVIYTKGGEEKSIAQAKNDTSYCDKTIGKMKEKLVSGGFTCE